MTGAPEPERVWERAHTMEWRLFDDPIPKVADWVVMITLMIIIDSQSSWHWGVEISIYMLIMLPVTAYFAYRRARRDIQRDELMEAQRQPPAWVPPAR
jgi:hypothetical protein